MEYIEDTRNHHNLVVVSSNHVEETINYTCTRCGAKHTLPWEAEILPYNADICIRKLKIHQSQE